MISHRLDIVLNEAIQAHADRHRHGKLDLEQILSALGELAASYIAKEPRGRERQQLFETLCSGIAKAANSKIEALETGAVPIS
jgi:hypothetical protein